MLPQIFSFFAQGLRYDFSKFSDNFTPFFWLWKTFVRMRSGDHLGEAKR